MQCRAWRCGETEMKKYGSDPQGERGVFTTSYRFCSECCKTDVNKAFKGNADVQNHLCSTHSTP